MWCTSHCLRNSSASSMTSCPPSKRVSRSMALRVKPSCSALRAGVSA
uniref:Uncharacterized protein n=1 Tax=Zea mays TaxID=4577 RepID=C4J860_MAIZE|nr:unknown [Zea mays]